ncbi:MAG TPA: type II toxin-antitoxin system RelE/ParE family toxin [Gammaproteobacteria bacterium]
MPRRPQELKEIRWRGDSQDAAHDFPKGARLKLGKELTRIQMGMHPRDGKWLTEVGQGAQEIRIAHSKEAYRVIYVAVFSEAVYVLHAFHKKSKAGKATPRAELDLAARRYRQLVRERMRS